jgi:hypothetical protein
MAKTSGESRRMRIEQILHPTSSGRNRRGIMTETQENTAGKVDHEVRFNKIDRTAPAGSENSLGAQSVRDGRPATDDSTVEAIDEEGPGIDTQPPTA